MARGDCVSCGAPLAGRYCHACGERDARERTLSLRGFLRESFHAVTDLNGRAPRSLRALVTRPGLLMREYVAGRRRPYLHPLQLFLLANLLFFIALPLTGMTGLSSPLRSQLYEQGYSELARDAIRERNLETDTVDFRTFEARFDLASEVQAGTLVIVLVPLFALLLFLTRFWKREPGVQHLVFGTHYIAALLLLLLAGGILLQLLRALPEAARGTLFARRTLELGILAAQTAYLYAALRRGYGDRRLPAALRAILLALGTTGLVVLYRLLLFFTVLYTV